MFQFNVMLANAPLTFTLAAAGDKYIIHTTLDDVKYEATTALRSVGPKGMAVVRELIEYVANSITIRKLSKCIVMNIPVPFLDDEIGVLLIAEKISEVEHLRRQVKKLELQNAECMARMRELEHKISKPVFTLEKLLELSRYIEGMGDDNIPFRISISKCQVQNILNIIDNTNIATFTKKCTITFNIDSNGVKNSRKVLGDIVSIIQADFSDEEHKITGSRGEQQCSFTGEIVMDCDLYKVLNVDFAIELMEDRYPFILLTEMDTFMKNDKRLEYAIYIHLYNRHGIVDQKININQTIEKYGNL